MISHFPHRQHDSGRAAFTLIELLSVIVIIGILVAMTFPLVGMVKSRMEKVHCVSNLKNLYTAANLYVQDNHRWPQINALLIKKQPQQYAQQWIAALSTYGVQKDSWICPSMQHIFGNPDYLQPNHERVDYVATPFDRKAFTPHQWSTQPWFAERGNVHGNGNLLIMSDGSIHELNEFAPKK